MTILRVKIAKLYPDAKIPTYGSEEAAGLDLYAYQSASIYAGESQVVMTGIVLEIPHGYEGQVRPRSGLAKKGITAVFGTIDSDYRGEIGVTLQHRYADGFPGPFTIYAGDRIGQLLIKKRTWIEFEEVASVNDLKPTERGTQGYGSTGR